MNITELTAKLRHWASMASVTSERVSCLSVEQLTEVAEALEAAEKRIADLESHPGAVNRPTVWVRYGDRNHAPDCTLDYDEAREWEARGLEVVRMVAPVPEARTLTVKLPQGYAVRAGHPINEGERSVMIPKDGGDWLNRFDVEHALHRIGFKLQIEGE